MTRWSALADLMKPSPKVNARSSSILSRTVINADLGVTLYLARRYDEAIEQLRKTLAIDSTFFYAHYNLGIALQLKGDLPAAIAEYEKAKQLSYDSFVLALLGAAKGLAGDKNAAEQVLKDIDQTAQTQGVDEYSPRSYS